MPINTTNNEIPSFKSNGILPLKSKLKMTDQDYNDLLKAAENERVDNFIQEYQKKHTGVTRDEIISVAINKLIVGGGSPLIEKLLFINDNITDISPLPITILDQENNNTISYALANDRGVEQLSSYMYRLKDSGKITEKFIMEDDLINKIAQAIIDYDYEYYTPKILIKKFIEPLYTEESVNNLIEVIGKDFIEDFY
nr:hypothetical protein [Rickettsia endosymbiont of Ceutorhynchus assimilis]